MLAAGVESEFEFGYALPTCARACAGQSANKQKTTAVEAVTFLGGDSLSGFSSSIWKQGLNITNAIG
jgi:hypothetical protein